MVVRLTREALEYYVLTYLSIKDSYGAQIFENFAPGINVSITTLYDVLRTLEATGKITTVPVVQNGVWCNLCSITRVGKRHLKAFLRQ